MNQANKQDQCPLCDSSDSKLWGLEFKGFRILKCRTCGLRYTDPQQEHETDLYRDNYFDDKAMMMADRKKLLLVIKSDLDSINAIAHVSSKMLNQNATILDVGTGRGSFLTLCRLLGFKNVRGTDITDSNLGSLRSFGIDLLVGDIVDLKAGEV